jgi:hypothetical protein
MGRGAVCADSRVTGAPRKSNGKSKNRVNYPTQAKRGLEWGTRDAPAHPQRARSREPWAGEKFMMLEGN